MYIEFLLSGLNVKNVSQAFIDKCRQRMPLAIIGRCLIKETLAGFILPSEYKGKYAINDDELHSTRVEDKHCNNTLTRRDSEEMQHSW
jgi:hypothetical protein